MSRTEFEEDLHAELGYRTAGRREVSQREWFSLQGEKGEAAPTPKAFKKLVNVLRVTKWQKANADHVRTYQRQRMRDRPAEVKKAHLASQTTARHDAYKANPPVFTCVGCGAVFCRVPWAQARGIKPKFCTQTCRNRNNFKPRRPGPIQRRVR